MARKNSFLDSENTETLENKKEQNTLDEIKEEINKIQNEGKKSFSKEGGTRLS